MNLVFYVCDTDTDYRSEHIRKMDAGRVIALHLQKGLNDCVVKKYTEYEGEMLSCDSVGLVVPAYRWGLSLAVYSFLQNLRVSSKTYVYISVVGETLSECSDKNIDIRFLNLNTLRKQFMKNKLGTDKDIYVRCIDIPRSIDYTEMKLKRQEAVEMSIEKILSGLLMYNIKSLESISECLEDKKVQQEMNSDTATVEKASMNTIRKRLNNVYLDEDMLAGVRLCRAL